MYDVVGGELPSHRVAEPPGQIIGIGGGIDAGGEVVEEGGQLYVLAVRPADQVRRHLECGALPLAEQLGARGEAYPQPWAGSLFAGGCLDHPHGGEPVWASWLSDGEAEEGVGAQRLPPRPERSDLEDRPVVGNV